MSLGMQRVTLPGVGAIGGMLGRVLPGAVIGAGRVAIAGVGRAARGAMELCRRHPAWCAQIGGTAAVAALIESGQLPAPRRRRARGITGREFRAFKRVHKVLSTFCAPRMRIRRKARA